MGGMTFTVAQLGQIFLAMCGAVITIGGAWAVIKNSRDKAKEPDMQRDETLKRHGEMLDNDNKRLKELEDGYKVFLQSMLALMSHEIDGNHTEQLRKAKEDLEKYLISR